jgi:cell fate regulator YaaT (PSP1 superfamily)
MSEGKQIANVVGVRFRSTGRVHYFDPGDDDLAVGDRVSVQTGEGPREGVVVIAPRQVLYSELRCRLNPVLGRVDHS